MRERRFGIGADRYRPKVTAMTKNGAAREGWMDGSTTRQIRERERLKQSYIAPPKTVKAGAAANGQASSVTLNHRSIRRVI